MAATARVIWLRMRKVLARPWVGVRVCHLLLLLLASTQKPHPIIVHCLCLGHSPVLHCASLLRTGSPHIRLEYE